MPSSKRYCECGASWPSFGLPNERYKKPPQWCSKCPSKPPEAISFHSSVKLCECGKGRAQLGLPGGKGSKKDARWCSQCPSKPPEAVDVKHKRCECGIASPHYSLPGYAGKGYMGLARWCSQCPSKPSDAVDAKANAQDPCECGASARATLCVLGENGKKIARWCRKCPSIPPEAASVNNKICECGAAIACFSPPGRPRMDDRWCSRCPNKRQDAVKTSCLVPSASTDAAAGTGSRGPGHSGDQEAMEGPGSRRPDNQSLQGGSAKRTRTAADAADDAPVVRDEPEMPLERYHRVLNWATAGTRLPGHSGGQEAAGPGSRLPDRASLQGGSDANHTRTATDSAAPAAHNGPEIPLEMYSWMLHLATAASRGPGHETSGGQGGAGPGRLLPDHANLQGGNDANHTTTKAAADSAASAAPAAAENGPETPLGRYFRMLNEHSATGSVADQYNKSLLGFHT